MTNQSDEIEKLKIDKEDKTSLDNDQVGVESAKNEKKIVLCQLNSGISDELKEEARLFNRSFQNLDLREETRYRISNFSNNLFSKNAEKSQKYRKTGNELYSSQRYEEALNAYNQALFSAPLKRSSPEDESNIDYALCLANRCAVFLQLKLYAHCLTDIDLAIKYNYPESKRKKLIERQKFCLQQLGDDLKQESVDRELINKTHVEADTGGKVVANQELKPGNIILEERAFCETLDKVKYYERCFNCLQLVDRYTYPCSGCSQVKFCSEKCSNEAWSTGHYLECNKISMLDLFKSNYSFECIQLAFKCLLKCNLNQVFSELRQSDQQESLLKILSKLKKEVEFKEADYASVAQIVTYLVDEHELPKKLTKSNDNSADYELFGALFSVLLNKLQSNTVSILLRDLKILELKNCPHSQVYQPFEEKEIGKALFPILSQIEHDLEPNCQILKFHNNTLVITALKEIKKGEKLLINKKSLYNYNRSLDHCLRVDHGLAYDDYRQDKSKYYRLFYKYGYMCIRCFEGAMLIFNERDAFYLECLKCKCSERFEKRDDESNEKFDKVQELINVNNFCVQQSRKAKLVLYSKQPNLRTVEHTLLDSYRDLKVKLFPSNLSLAEIEFDLSICYLQMRMYLKAIKHAMNASNNWKSHFTTNEIQYYNGLMRLINVQNCFVHYTNTTNKELDDEHITLYNFNLDNLRENLKHLIEIGNTFFSDSLVQHKLFVLLNDMLNSVKQFQRK